MVAWYHTKYSGSKAAHLWQISAGISLTLVLVVLPASFDYIMRREGKKYVGPTMSTGKVIDTKYTLPKRVVAANQENDSASS